MGEVCGFSHKLRFAPSKICFERTKRSSYDPKGRLPSKRERLDHATNLSCFLTTEVLLSFLISGEPSLMLARFPL